MRKFSLGKKIKDFVVETIESLEKNATETWQSREEILNKKPEFYDCSNSMCLIYGHRRSFIIWNSIYLRGIIEVPQGKTPQEIIKSVGVYPDYIILDRFDLKNIYDQPVRVVDEFEYLKLR